MVIFRLTNSFGPREQYIPNKNAINYLIYRAYKGEDITLFNKGKTVRDLIYISDVISGIEIIMKKGKSGEVYWISSGKKINLYQFAKLLKNITHAQIKYSESTSYTKKVDVGNFVVNNYKIKSLGWKPQTSLKDGILKTMNYFRTSKF